MLEEWFVREQVPCGCLASHRQPLSRREMGRIIPRLACTFMLAVGGPAGADGHRQLPS